MLAQLGTLPVKTWPVTSSSPTQNSLNGHRGDRGGLADTDLPTSKPSPFQMFFHLQLDIASVPSFSRRIYFWVPAHHPLPSNFMLNKAHSLALFLGSELLGFEKAELRRGNGCA